MAVRQKIGRFIQELFNYGFVSAIALVLDASCLLLLAQITHYIAAATVSYLAGGIVAYILSTRFVFSEHRLRDKRGEFAAFLSLGAVGLAVNNLTITITTTHLGTSLLAGKLMATGATFTCNFLLRKLILFSTPVTEPDPLENDLELKKL